MCSSDLILAAALFLWASWQGIGGQVESSGDRVPIAVAVAALLTAGIAIGAAGWVKGAVVSLVMAAALAAIMSTSSGALIATATVAKEDIVGRLFKRQAATPARDHDEVQNSRVYIFGFGIIVVALACVLQDVVAALTVAYDILVGGLAVAIIGGIIWKRATITGALASIVAGTVVTLGGLAYAGDLYANPPIFEGLITSLAAYVIGSLASKPTGEAIRAEWERRIGHKREDAPAGETI